MSRFAPRFSDQELLAIVRAVAEYGRPDDPEQITQAAYDEARAGAGRPDTPRAWRIAQRLNSSWSQVLHLALEADTPGQVIGARSAKRLRKVLTKAEVRHSLRRVAESLGTDALSTHDYNTERERIIERDEDRWLRGGQQEMLLPTAQTIIRRAGSWEQALTWADLRPGRQERLPVYPAERALDDFIADYGWAPRRNDLLAYQDRRGMATTDVDGDWLVWVRAQLRSGIASRHGSVRIVHGSEKTPTGWETRIISPAPAGWRPKHRAPTDLITVEECERSIERALDLAAGASLTQRLYQRLATSHGLLSMSSIQRAASREEPGLSWAGLRDRVVERRAQQPRQQGRRATGKARPSR